MIMTDEDEGRLPRPRSAHRHSHLARKSKGRQADSHSHAWLIVHSMISRLMCHAHQETIRVRGHPCQRVVEGWRRTTSESIDELMALVSSSDTVISPLVPPLQNGSTRFYVTRRLDNDNHQVEGY